HGCAGHVHVCPCCAHPVLGHAVLGIAVPVAPDDSEHLTLARANTGPEGTATLVFRPPIAG
ncbi:MAG TPA: hypothetical protein VFU02_04565, partial [Polyangiaceae bacterium]|nr:hypothetical protein [Polyangiaceae bacterium]